MGRLNPLHMLMSQRDNPFRCQGKQEVLIRIISAPEERRALC